MSCALSMFISMLVIFTQVLYASSLNRVDAIKMSKMEKKRVTVSSFDHDPLYEDLSVIKWFCFGYKIDVRTFSDIQGMKG